MLTPNVSAEAIPNDRDILDSRFSGSIPSAAQAGPVVDVSTGTADPANRMAATGDAVANDNFATLAVFLNALNGREENWVTGGTNSDPALITPGVRGGRVVTTAGAAGDEQLIQPRAGSRGSQGYNTSRAPRYSVLFETPADISNLVFRLGLGLTPNLVPGTDNDEAVFFFDASSSSEVQCAVSVGGVLDQRVGGGSFGALLAATLYEGIIDIGPDRIARFWWRRAIAGTPSQLGDASQIGRVNGASVTIPFAAMTANTILFPQNNVGAGAVAAATSMTFYATRCAHGLS